MHIIAYSEKEYERNCIKESAVKYLMMARVPLWCCYLPLNYIAIWIFPFKPKVEIEIFFINLLN